MQVSKTSLTSENRREPSIQPPSLNSLQKSIKEMMDMRTGKKKKKYITSVK